MKLTLITSIQCEKLLVTKKTLEKCYAIGQGGAESAMAPAAQVCQKHTALRFVNNLFCIFLIFLHF